MRTPVTDVPRLVLLPIIAAAAFLVLLTLSSCGGLGEGEGGSNVEGPPRDTTPVVLEITQPGALVYSDGRAVLDYSNAAEGYVCVMSNMGETKVKVLVDVANTGTQYQYTIDSGGYFITIPLSEGSGGYTIGVWENISGDSYAAVFSQYVEVALNNEFSPFLYPNQFVNFAAGDEATALSQELAEGSVTDVDALNNIYKWVCSNIDYDVDKATVLATATGYLPNNASTIAEKKGICFDYAVLTASMLRAQRVPAKLVIGYAGTVYHAWMHVYCVDTGTVVRYDFNGNEWVLMDPTFDAASGGTRDLSSVVGDGNSYQEMFFY